jgi:hypothetical protein
MSPYLGLASVARRVLRGHDALHNSRDIRLGESVLIFTCTNYHVWTMLIHVNLEVTGWWYKER